MKSRPSKDLANAAKGFAMGAANVVPGVSGGTIALLTGIYSEIVEALDSITSPQLWKSLFKGEFRKCMQIVHGRFLLFLGIGIVLSVITLAKAVTWALAYYPVLVWAFFFGLIIASLAVMLRRIKGWSLKDILPSAAGLCSGLFICLLTPATTPDSLWFIFICGAISICTMILPGVSGSFILVVLGKYDYIMKAIGTLDWGVLLVFAAGCAAGLLAFAKFLNWLLSKWERTTMIFLLCFVLGTLVRVWPWADMKAVGDAQVLRGGPSCPVDLQTGWAILCAVLGAVIVLLTEHFSSSRSKA